MLERRWKSEPKVLIPKASVPILGCQRRFPSEFSILAGWRSTLYIHMHIYPLFSTLLSSTASVLFFRILLGSFVLCSPLILFDSSVLFTLLFSTLQDSLSFIRLCSTLRSLLCLFSSTLYFFLLSAFLSSTLCHLTAKSYCNISSFFALYIWSMLMSTTSKRSVDQPAWHWIADQDVYFKVKLELGALRIHPKKFGNVTKPVLPAKLPLRNNSFPIATFCLSGPYWLAQFWDAFLN